MFLTYVKMTTCTVCDINEDSFINHIFKYTPIKYILNFCISCTDLIYLCSNYNLEKIFRVKYPDVYKYIKILGNKIKLNYRIILRDLDIIYRKEYVYDNTNNRTYINEIQNKLTLSIHNHRIWNVYYLIETGYNVAENNQKALNIVCSERGYVEEARLLLGLPLDRGLDISVRDNLVVYNAIEGGHTEIVKMLLELPKEYKVNFDEKWYSYYEKAHNRKHKEMMSLLVDEIKYRNIDYQTNSLIFWLFIVILNDGNLI